MLASDVITDARGAISDESSVRWTDAVLLRYLFDGELEVVRRHPESQYHTTVSNSAPTLLTATTDTLTVGNYWRMALVNYICYRVYQEDQEDAHNRQLALDYLKLFQEAL